MDLSKQLMPLEIVCWRIRLKHYSHRTEKSTFTGFDVLFGSVNGAIRMSSARPESRFFRPTWRYNHSCGVEQGLVKRYSCSTHWHGNKPGACSKVAVRLRGANRQLWVDNGLCGHFQRTTAWKCLHFHCLPRDLTHSVSWQVLQIPRKMWGGVYGMRVGAGRGVPSISKKHGESRIS